MILVVRNTQLYVDNSKRLITASVEVRKYTSTTCAVPSNHQAHDQGETEIRDTPPAPWQDPEPAGIHTIAERGKQNTEANTPVGWNVYTATNFQDQIEKAIMSVSSNKAARPDLVIEEAMKTAPKRQAKFLANLWLAVGRTGCFLSQRTKCTIVPPYKKRDATKPIAISAQLPCSHTPGKSLKKFKIMLEKLVKLSICNKQFTRCKYSYIPFNNYYVEVRIRFPILSGNC